MIKICVECGKDFEAKGRALCCSKKCRKEHRKEYKKEYQKKYQNRPEVIERRKHNSPETKERQKKYNSSPEIKEKNWKKSGIKNMTMERYNKLLKEQNSNCSICGINMLELGVKLSVDHCHENGEVRGLLCRNCNAGLGIFKDNIDILASAISYLQQESI